MHHHYHPHHPPQAVQSSQAPQQTVGRSQSQRQVRDTTTATVTAASPPCPVSLCSVSISSFGHIFAPGRSSCISPMSELSSSSGSSRTSLRSSSIVSASNILLEEEGEEEVEYKDLCKELLLFAPPDSRISGIISKIWTTSQSHRSSLSFQGQI